MTQRRQVNLRLSEAQYEVLEVLAFLRRSPKSEVLLPCVVEFLEQAAASPEVRELLPGRQSAENADDPEDGDSADTQGRES
jgi:hypothetical protein